MFTVIFSDGYQFNATFDSAVDIMKHGQGAKITKKYVRGPLSIIECESPWESHDGYTGISKFMLTCASVDVMQDLLQSWAKQF